MPDNANQLAPETMVLPEVATIDTPEASHLAFANKAGVPTVKNSSGTETALGSPTAPLTLTGTSDTNQLVVIQNATQTANPVEIRDSGGNDQIIFTPDGGATFNEEGNNVDFRVESDTKTHAIYVQGSTGNIGINNSSPDDSAMIDMSSTTQGFGPPAMTHGQIAIMSSPRDGLMAFSTTEEALFQRAGVNWIGVGAYAADGHVFTNPVDNSISWTDLNQASGTFTEDTTYRRLHIVGDGNATRQVRGWYTASPTVPYSLRLYIGGWSQEVAAGSFLGVGFRQDSTTELVVLEIASNTASGSLVFALGKWNSPTSFNSNYIAGTDIHLLPNWIKLEDDNTNRIISVSWDGIAWTVLHTIGRTDFLTADGIFFGCVPNTNATYDFNASLLSYEVL